MRALIVNADDFGLTRGVSAGILAAYRHGIVTSTTVMITLDLDREQLPGPAVRAGRKPVPKWLGRLRLQPQPAPRAPVGAEQ